MINTLQAGTINPVILSTNITLETLCNISDDFIKAMSFHGKSGDVYAALKLLAQEIKQLKEEQSQGETK